MSRRPRIHSGVRKHELTQRMKVLAASALAQKIGYLRLDDLPDTRIFETLPTQSFSANRIIRSKDELLLLKHGAVEIWHTHHDFLVKDLSPGMLFGEMPLLGQTMLGTKSLSLNLTFSPTNDGARKVKH